MMFGLGTKAWSAIAGALVVLGAVFAGVAMASGDDFDPVYAPEWQPGYSFSYDVVADLATHVSGSFNGYSLDEETGVPEDFAATIGPIPVKKEVLATGYDDATGAPVYVSAANVPLSSIQLGTFFDDFGSAPAFATAERQGDLAPVLVFPASSQEGGLYFPDMAPETSQPDSTPITYLDFPLTPEKRWGDSVVELGIPMPIDELDGLDRMHYVGEVTGMETVDLGPLGTTEAVRVDLSYTPVGIEEFVSMYAAQAEEMGFDLERYTLQLGLHEIVWYSDDFESIVKHEYIIHGLIDVAISGEIYGEPIDFEFYAEVDALVSALLTGAEHPQGLPDKTPEEILNTLGNPALIHDATGNSATSQLVPYAISMWSDRDQVNVADDEMAIFGIDISGVDYLPEGHEIVWDVFDSQGESVAATGDGEALLFTPDEPGIYKISAAAYSPDGALMSSASRALYADFDGFVEADMCALSITGFNCYVERLAVEPGIDTLVIEAIVDGLAPLSSDLSVTDAAGHQVERGYDHVQVEDFDDFAYGDWSAEYTGLGNLDSDVEFYVLLDYEPGMVHDHGDHVHDDGDGASSGGSESPLEQAFAAFDFGIGRLP